MNDRINRLPPWTSLVLLGIAFLMYPLAVYLSRTFNSDALEAIPFVVAGVGILAAAFSKPGETRKLGLVAAAIFVLSPIWLPMAVFSIDESQSQPHMELWVHVLPEDREDFELLLPAPQTNAGGSVDLAGLLPPEVSQVNGGSASSPFFNISDGVSPMQSRQVGVDALPELGDFSPSNVELRHGDTNITFLIQLRLTDGCREDVWAISGIARPSGEGFIRGGVIRGVC